MTEQKHPVKVDLLLSASWLISVNKNFEIFENYTLAIDKGRIVDILPTTQAEKAYQAEQTQNLSGQALLPGFINCHNHAAMTLLRGFADDMPLQQWLNDFIWPTEVKWMSADFVRDGTLLACAEMIKSGTTCFNDMYFFPDVAANIALSCQMRACLSFPVLEFPSAWAQNADDYIHKGLALHDQYKNNSLLKFAFGPHAPYTVKIETMQRINTLAEELDLNIHIHLHENQQEVADYKKLHQYSAIEHYAQTGLLSPRLQAVHMTHLSPHDCELIARHQVSVVHCPESNMKLASGICNVKQLRALGIKVSLGTDGCASNNDLDMIGEMKSAALLAKVSTLDASALPVQNVLAMATIEGAKTLGIDKDCGSLEKGKYADVISIDLSQLESTPVYHPVSQIVYNAHKNQVKNVWVQGKQLLKNGELKHINEPEVIHKAKLWRNKINATH